MTDKQEKFFNILNNSPKVAYDVETNGLRWQTMYVCGYSVSNGQESVYIPTRHNMPAGGIGNIENVEKFEKHLAGCINNNKNTIIGHNIKFDSHFSENHGVKLNKNIKDTMTRAALINENKMSYSLENCAKTYPDIPQKKGTELYEHIARKVGCKPNSKSMAYYHILDGDDPIAVEYAEFDTLSTYHLFEKQEKDIYSQELEKVEGMEHELTYVLQKMERRGIKVDLQEYERAAEQIEIKRLEAYQNLPLKETLESINIKSNKDLQEYFQLCEIDSYEYTEPTERHPNGQPSFNKDWLGTSEAGEIILNARKYDTCQQMFIHPFKELVHEGRIHTNFNQTRSELGGAKPGRLSSNNPNMQFVPKRDEEIGRIVRKAFIPDKDYVFVEYDHSQAEPRLFAHYSGEQLLLDGYHKTPFVDMHSIVGKMMNIDRKTAKNLNLGVLYTMGSTKLSKKLKISYDEAKYIVGRWHRTFPQGSAFTKKAQQVAEQRGYVKTILGRRARFPDPRWAYRAANRIIQGSSADILKWKMVQINRWIEHNKYDDFVHLLLNIHDAILVQIHKDYLHLVPELGKLFADVLGAPFNLKVPFHSDYHMGNNWMEASYGAN